MARPSKYDTDVAPRLLEVAAWSRDGLTLEQIAHNLGIALSTFMEYKKSQSDLSEALKKGKEVVDIEVENALLKNALGYYYTEQTVTPSGRVVDVRRFEKPNTTAQIFWLKNRKRTEWRDKHELSAEVENSGKVEVVLNVPQPKVDI